MEAARMNPTNLKLDDKIWVRDEIFESWRPRYFYRFSDDLKLVYVFADGATSWSECGTELWHQWKLPE